MASCRDHGGVGGQAVYFSVDAEVLFRDDDGLRRFVMPVYLGKATAESERLPSILGWDVLSHVAVYVNRREGIVTLTPIE